MSQRILRPLSYGDLLDELFDLYKKNFLLFSGIVGLVYIPFALLSTIAMLPMINMMGNMGPGSTPSDPSAMFSSLIPIYIKFAAIAIVAGIFQVAAMGAITWAISSTYLGKKPTILASYKAVIPRLLPLIVTGIIAYMMVIAGTIACILPGIALSVFLAFTTQAIMLENKSYFNAIGRTFELSAGAFWQIFVIGLLAMLLVYFIQLAVYLPFQFATAAAASNPSLMTAIFLVQGLFSGIANSVALPILLSALVLLYYDVRVRKEGFDIEMLAASIEGGTTGSERA